MKIVIDIPTDALAVIKRLKFLVGGRDNRKLQMTVINAIKNGTALTECEDCISRKAIFEMLVDIDNAIYDGDGFQYQEWHTKVDELPSVTPKNDNSVLEKIRQIVNNWNDDENAMILADSIKKGY